MFHLKGYDFLSRPRLEKRFKCKIAKKLGVGDFGTAYLLKGGKRVLKITTDVAEISAIKRIASLERKSGKKLSGFVKIFGKPRKLKSETDFEEPVYGYIREYVDRKERVFGTDYEWDLLTNICGYLTEVVNSKIPKNIINSALELASRGYSIADLHSRHVGKSGRSWKIFDVRGEV